VISCSQAVKQLWDYVAGAVDGPQRAALEEHLGVCRRCCGEVEFAAELAEFLERHGEVALPQDARSRLNSYLDEALRGLT
jgi:hypothetical protein